MLGGSATVAALGSSGDELGQVLALHRASGVDAPERLTVSDGDRRLLALHRAVTGRDVELVASCGACSAVSEAVLGPDTVPPPAPRSAWLGGAGGLRQPTYADLVGAASDVELVRRCVVGEPARAPTPEDLDRIDDSLVGPVRLACAGCGAPLEIAVDVEQLALAGLARHCAEIEREIHLLASAYGWSLAAIEALPDDRRRRLAELVAEGW